MADDQLAHDLNGTGPMLVAVHGITEIRRFWDPFTCSSTSAC